MAANGYAPKNAAEFKVAQAKHGDLVLDDLTELERESSPSKWGLRHLLAYRLLFNQQPGFLHDLERDHEGNCPVCCSDEPGVHSQQISRSDIEDLVAKRNIESLLLSSNSSLMQLRGGFFWVALARASRPSMVSEARVHPDRQRGQVVRDHYASTMDVVDGSSSPIVSSSSEFEVSFGLESVDVDEHEARRAIPEEVTVQLTMAFLQFVLHLCLVQDSGEPVEFRPRVERRRSTVRTGSTAHTAEDDGGLVRMERSASGWEPAHEFMAVIEAKRAFTYFVEDKATGEAHPMATDKTLAQYLGEALATRSSNRALIGDKYETALCRDLWYAN
jgi:hypothetical protein